MGMVGGGAGSFIGPVHCMAAELDGAIELVAGAFSQDPERSRQAGVTYRIDPDRAYTNYQEMMDRESKRKDPIDFVCIVTPNHLHLPIAVAALEHGFHVMSDKPATANLKEAQALEAVVQRTGLLYGLTFTYTGYPLVREARLMARSGELGKIRKAVVQYQQGWLSSSLETTGHKQAAWRSDPSQSGMGGAIGDIGTHAFHLLEYISGLKVTEMNATLRSVVPGRRLDDDCNAFLRMNNGAAGTLACSQIAAGELNEMRVRIYGETGSIEWRQQDPNRLIVKWLDGPEEIHHAAASYLSGDALAVARVPSGHPEGYLEAFAVLYREFADALGEWKKGNAHPLPATLPGIEAGVRGMRFIERVIESDRTQSWVKF
jgi:predicted dehydrogenase